MSRTNAGPIFVVGYMHSGTTLLYSMLKRSPLLFGGRAETKFFDYLPMTLDRYPDLGDVSRRQDFVAFAVSLFEHGYPLSPTPPELLQGAAHLTRQSRAALARRTEGLRDHAQVFRVVADYLAEQAGCPRWIEKTPTHVFHIHSILTAVPDATFVEIVRDPRDVLASKKTRRMTVWTSDRYSADERPAKHLEKAYDPFLDSLSWKAAIQAGLQARRRTEGSVVHVRYEDLVTNPRRELERLCSFLCLPFDSLMLEVGANNAAEWRAEQRRGIVQDSLRRYRRVLRSSEVSTCQVLTGGEMKEHHYTPDRVDLLSRMSFVFHAARATVGIVVRLFRRWRMGRGRYLRSALRGYGRRFLMLHSAENLRVR